MFGNLHLKVFKMKSSYDRRAKRKLKSNIVKRDLKTSGYHYRRPGPPFISFYSASCLNVQGGNLGEAPKHREVIGEYLEVDPELEETAFGYEPALSKREMGDSGILTSLVDMDESQARYEIELESKI